MVSVVCDCLYISSRKESSLNAYRILRRFPLIVQLALLYIPFVVDKSGGGKECGTGECPLAVALLLAGFKPTPGTSRFATVQKPIGTDVAQIMLKLGLIYASELDKVATEAMDFIGAYSRSNHMWKRALRVTKQGR